MFQKVQSMKKFLFLPIAALLAATLVLSFPGAALAGKDKGHSHKSEQGNNDISWFESGDAKITIRIGLQDRAVIKEYLGREHRKHCPPGLAKKNNGCLPPGIAKKYAIGERLPDGIALGSLPAELLKLLGPAPGGYMYARVDKDVLLIGEATKKVVDAVTLLSAVGN
jgi:hypothetical protein